MKNSFFLIFSIAILMAILKIWGLFIIPITAIMISFKVNEKNILDLIGASTVLALLYALTQSKIIWILLVLAAAYIWSWFLARKELNKI